MQLVLCFTGLEPTAAIREHIRSRLHAIARLLPPVPATAHIAVRGGSEHHRVDAEISFAAVTLRTHQTSASVIAGTDLALDDIETQARTRAQSRPVPAR